jgi:hypothetical protein
MIPYIARIINLIIGLLMWLVFLIAIILSICKNYNGIDAYKGIAVAALFFGYPLYLLIKHLIWAINELKKENKGE